jgi:membrane-associated phospholipid phosphatase
MTTWLYPVERRFVWARRRRVAVVVLVVYLVLALLDHAAYRWWHVGDVDALEKHDWFRLFRVLGTMWTWVLFGAALALAGRAGVGLRLLASAGLAGAAAELLKLPFGRLRPIHADGAYEYLGLWERFTNPSHGGPSSHAAVAFGALALLGFLWPRTMPLLLLAACGCAATRVVAGAHFLTDVYVGALCGIGCAWALRPRVERRRVFLP